MAWVELVASVELVAWVELVASVEPEAWVEPEAKADSAELEARAVPVAREA